MQAWAGVEKMAQNEEVMENPNKTSTDRELIRLAAKAFGMAEYAVARHWAIAHPSLLSVAEELEQVAQELRRRLQQ